MWANSVWGFFSLAAACGLGVLGLPPAWMWMQPLLLGAAAFCLLGSLTILCWPLRLASNRAIVVAKLQHPRKWVAELIEPTYVIILGLVIALAGVFWQLRSERVPTTVAVSPGIPQASSVNQRSKQEITELLAESGALLDIIEKTGIPLADEWRKLMVNPARICHDLDLPEHSSHLSDLATKFRQAQKQFSAIFEQNRIDQKELGPLVGGGAITPVPRPFEDIASYLDRYRQDISVKGTHPKCEEVVTDAFLANFIAADRRLGDFSRSLVGYQENIKRYRDELRQRLRSAS